MKPTIAKSSEFLSWIEDQSKEQEYNYKATSYYRIKVTENNKRIFKMAATLLLAFAIGILMIISVIL